MNFRFAAQYTLLCGKKYFPKQTGKEGNDAFVRKEERILAKQGATRLERFELPLELLDANDATDEPNACLVEEIFVFPLRVFRNEANSRCARVDKRMLDRAVHNIRSKTEETKVQRTS